jgi:hypothetical protein
MQIAGLSGAWEAKAPIIGATIALLLSIFGKLPGTHSAKQISN